jgi:hypothetical protein
MKSFSRTGFVVPLALAVLASCAVSVERAANDQAEEATTYIRPEAIRADMRFLADDLLEGRGTGTRGHEIAAKFIAAQFEADGLDPAGDNGTFFQSVPLRRFRPDATQTSVTLVRAGKEETLAFREDFIVQGDAARKQTNVEAPVVYVGYGVTAPDQAYDDYQGIDARGKIVAWIFGAPPKFPTTLRAHYTSPREKLANAVAHGAVGTLSLDTPELERAYPFRKRVRDLAFPRFRWLSPQGKPSDYFEQIRGSAFLSSEGMNKLFAGSGKTADALLAAARESKAVSFELPVAARIHLVTQLEDVRSPNVVALLRGSDPSLRNEYVAYTAHSDHLGIGEPVNGDNIYNGAVDNASGSACLLEIAKAFSRANPRPRRSILFLSVTGEEAGLLGSDYFAHYPTTPKNAIVADINMDGAAMLWPLEDVVALGEEHSTLGVQVREAAARLNLGVGEDPFPELVFFIRSDQYSFVRQGVPAVMSGSGFKSSDPKIQPKEILLKWFATVYHMPSDDMNQPLDFDAAAKYARFNFFVGYFVAQQTVRPAWKNGDFFGEKYGEKR